MVDWKTMITWAALNWLDEITFVIFDDTVIFGEFEGDCYKQKYRLN